MSDDDSSSSTETPEKFRIEIVQKSFGASSELQEEDVELGHFIEGYLELNKFIGLLGKVFHFVQVDVREKTAKLRELYQKAPTYQSVKKMIAFEHEKKDYTGSKALLALHRALVFICAFINALAESTNEDSVSLMCRKSYEDTLASCARRLQGKDTFSTFSADNVFVRITASGDTIAATLAIGRVYVWSNVSQKGVQDSAFIIHWHKVAPSIALTHYGGLLSAGAEGVFCKFTLTGTGRPSMLPRLAAAVRDLALSDDDSHVAIVLEDNSLHVVVTSSVNILSTLDTVATCKRSLNTIFTTFVFDCDPTAPNMLVMNGKPGSLRWIDCASSGTDHQTSFSLENVADGDMSFAGITQTFPDVEQVFLSSTTIVTLETVINFEEEHKRLRFWERIEGSHSVQVVDSFIVSKDTIDVTGFRQPQSISEKVIIYS